MVDRTHSIKIGSLWKRSSANGGRSFFTKRNYRPRVFILTHQTLCFYSGNVNMVGSAKGKVDVPTIRAVEFVDDNAFGLPHTFQVTHSSKKHGFQTIYITATDKTECAEWVAKLRKECQSNGDMLMHYHSGAFTKNSWTCCGTKDKTALGCQPTYFLLTKSSSRYADLRRKDTLTRKPSLKQTPMHRSTENIHCVEDRPMSSCAVRRDHPQPSPLMPSNSDLDMVHSVSIQNGGILSREELLTGRSTPQVSPLISDRGTPQGAPRRSSFAPSCSSNGTSYDEQNNGAPPTVTDYSVKPATPLKSSASNSSSVSSTPTVHHKTSLASIGEPLVLDDMPPPIPPRSAVRMKRTPSPAPPSHHKPPVPPRKESNKTAATKPSPQQPAIRPPLIPTISLPSINHNDVTSSSHDAPSHHLPGDSPHRALLPTQSSPIALRKRKPINKPLITPRLVHNNPNMIQL